MGKKYFTISVILNTLFYILAILVPGLFPSSFVNIVNIILLIILIVLPAIFGLIYLFITENKKWVILGLLIDFFTITLLFLVFLGLQSRRA